MDRNQIIGFALLAALLITYIVYNNHSQSEYEAQKRVDSLAQAKAHPLPKVDSSQLHIVAKDSLPDSASQPTQPGFSGVEETIVLENDKLVIHFSTKGAHPISALLKDYKTYDQQ